ncbi:MAG: glucose-1-phosphate adenylyltransferase [Acidobacteria bacterium]|nr:MAG: glucose-1-phosphate adenylyltransferase [Acidobacteriota bacterium]
MKDILGLILGGGKGTRLFPLTLVRSKPAVPLGGKYRLIDIPISNCINSGINKIFVLTQYNSASLHRHITQTYKFGFFSQGFVDILAAEQTPESIHWFQGTADAVRQTLRHILTYNVKYILILSGDQLYRMDYGKVVEQHLARKADISVCVIPVEETRASGFGMLKMEKNGRMTEFNEKPKEQKVIDRLKVDVKTWKEAGVSHEKPLLASMGIYLFHTDILVEVLKDESKLDFGRDIIPAALQNYNVYGYIFNGYWEDIGTIGAFYQANLDLTAECPHFNFYDPQAPIYTHPRFLPASRMENCQIESSIISEGCSIRNAKIVNSVIGIRTVVDRQAEICNSLVMGADFYDANSLSIPVGIGSNTKIKDAIIDKNARIGRNVRIENARKLKDFDGGNYYVRDSVVIIPKNAVIEDGTVI